MMGLLFLLVQDLELAREVLNPTKETREKLKKRDSPLARAYLASKPDDVFKKYVEKLPVELNVEAHAKVIGDLLQLDGDLAQLLAAAHFEAMGDAKLQEALAPKLKLSKVNGVWTSSGPAWSEKYLKVYKSMKAGDPVEEIHKALVSLKTPHTDALAANVKPFIPCKRCKGQSKKPCDACKEAGERTASCSTCGGAGQILKGTSARTGKDIIENCSACKGKGKWQIDCPSCEGGQIVCATCKGAAAKAPSIAEWASEEKCGFCSGSGSHFAVVRYPCAFCKGLGVFLKPKGAEDKLVGPREP
jgi:hypothetical protein